MVGTWRGHEDDHLKGPGQVKFPARGVIFAGSISECVTRLWRIETS
jgi:hypothetical protein